MVQSITLIEGDGVGPEIIHAAQRIVDATGIKIQWEMCDTDAKVFKKGPAHSSALFFFSFNYAFC